jgi:tetratricopeptide (TPR) repeat protein
MTDEFKSISVESQSSDMDDDFIADVDEQRKFALSSDDELAFGTDSDEKRFSISALWQNLRRAFLPTNGERAEQVARRINHLSSAIESSPDSPTNYVLRGELYLETGDYSSAATDFRNALELATARVENEDWGIIAQAMQDRAQEGLAEAERHTL